MAIVISGVNNNDKITATDGTIDLLSSANLTGILTAPAFTASGNITAASINVGNNIQLGNAGVATATTFVGNLTGNVNATSNLLLQIGGSEKFRVASSGQLGIGGANYGTSGQVLTSGGSGSAATWSTPSTPAVTGFTNGADNRVVTATGANALNGEANLQFDGTQLGIGGSPDVSFHIKSAAPTIRFTDTDTNRFSQIYAVDGNLRFDADNNNAQSGTNIIFRTDNTERLSINSEGAISVQSSLTGNTALAYLKNSRTRASGNKYGIEFRDNINEANANIVIQQNSSGNNAAHMSFYINGGTGGNGLENGNHTLRLKQGGDVEIPTGNIEFRSLGSSSPQAAPASINMGGTHSNAAGNGTNLNAKLKVWSDGTDMMGLSVSSNQLDYIVTQEVYDHVWYGGNSGTSELMRLEGDGDLILTNGNKFNINAASAAGQGGALINIGWDGGTNIATKAIDIGGGWSSGENKRITFSHSTGSNNLVGEINSIHYGGTPSRTSPHSGLRFGKLYHNGDSTTFTMSLDSTSTTNADLNLRGAYRSNYHPAFSLAASTGQSNIGTTATKITYVVPSTIGRNQDNLYDTSNHRFVAPVDGVYSFYARHWFTAGQTGTAWLYFYRNGSQIKESRMSISSAPGDYVNIQLTSTIFLSATNYIEVYGRSSSGTIFHVSNGSFHTEFSGFMVC